MDENLHKFVLKRENNTPVLTEIEINKNKETEIDLIAAKVAELLRIRTE